MQARCDHPVEPAAARVVVRVAVDTAAIRRSFAMEKPPVPPDDWDHTAYVEYRVSAYRSALREAALPGSHGGVRVDVTICLAGEASRRAADTLDCPASAGDAVQIEAAGAVSQASLHGLRELVVGALRPLFADAGAWRRFLRPAYFERHRAWRSAVGGPIQH